MAFKSRNIMISIDGVRLLGVKSKSLTIANEFVDISNDQTDIWQVGLDGAGDRIVTLSGAGIFKDDAAFNQVQTLVFDGDFASMVLEFENGDYITGNFVVTSLQYIGEHFDIQQYAISLESVVDGSVTLTRSADTTNYRVTEDGTIRTIESGTIRVIE